MIGHSRAGCTPRLPLGRWEPRVLEMFGTGRGVSNDAERFWILIVPSLNAPPL